MGKTESYFLEAGITMNEKKETFMRIKNSTKRKLAIKKAVENLSSMSETIENLFYESETKQIKYSKEEINEALFHLGYSGEHRLKVLNKLKEMCGK